MKETVNVLITAEEIASKVNALAKELNNKFNGRSVTIISVLTGGLILTADLIRGLDLDIQLDFVSLSSYGNSTTTSGAIKINKDLSTDISQRDVIIIEDIVDTGCTLNFLVKYLKEKSPASITLCTLLDKPSRRSVDITVDYSLFTIPDKFVVGYGLDYAQRYRHLPYIGVLSFENE